jgi:hypothetical protein
MTELAICIKEYECEESLFEYEEGEITKEEIIIYKVGDEGVVDTHLYNKEYWKLKEI